MICVEICGSSINELLVLRHSATTPSDLKSEHYHFIFKSDQPFNSIQIKSIQDKFLIRATQIRQ